ncbi:hypothetical protein GW17_00041190, partial [Ensete ventricosum]
KKLTYKQFVAKPFNTKVDPHQLKEEDLALRKVKVSNPTYNRGKLVITWEGSYQILEELMG